MKLILNKQITKIVILILFLFSNSLLGQKTVLKTISHANNKSKEVFHVSMNDESIKIAYMFIDCQENKYILSARVIMKDGSTFNVPLALK